MNKSIPLMLRGSLVKLVAVVVVLMISLSSFAQQYHFIYIQADNQQPFYVKYDGKNYSSSSIGYLILPRLSDGTFSIEVGFPRNLYPEQTFNISIAGKDYGYALKNFDNKGWGLFNFQTTDIVMNVNAAAQNDEAVKQTTITNNSNPFSNMLADAIDDSTLNQQHIPADTVSSKTALPVAVIADTPAAAMSGVSQPVKTKTEDIATIVAHEDSSTSGKTNTEALQENPVKNDSANSIVKSSQSTNSNGIDITFLDNAGKDTIRAFIPTEDTVTVEKKAAMADSAKSKVDNPFFNNSTAASVSQPPMLDNTSVTNIKSSIITNTSCQAILSSYDANKLKKKIAGTDKQDAILAAIRKTLRDKCMTTEQVKDFGNLFLSDENRYGFYDAVYPFVSDYFNFSQLENSLIDSYYKNRFKALLRQ